MQACNPPDIFWPLARWLRRATAPGSCSTTTTCARSSTVALPDGAALPPRACCSSSATTFRTADRVTSTNESYAAVAVDARRQAARARHGRAHRAGPAARCSAGRRLRSCAGARPPRRLPRGDGPAGRCGHRARAPPTSMVNRLGRRRHRVHAHGRRGLLRRPGRAARPARPARATSSSPAGCRTSIVAQVLSTADVGLCPDPQNPLNDVSTMNKTMEYMAFGLPVVAFDLRETRVSAGDAAVYVEPNDVGGYARADRRAARRPGRGAPRWARRAASASSRSWRGSTSGARLRRASSTSSAARHVAPHRSRPHRARTGAECAGSRGLPAARRQGARHDDGRPYRPPRAGRRAASSRSSTPTPRSCLGHRRLSIIDLSTAADQPFAKGGLTLSYNGELYNYRELRHELEARGVRFATSSDTEVVLEAWRAWGAGALRAVPRHVRVRDPRRAAPAASPWPATRSASSPST